MTNGNDAAYPETRKKDNAYSAEGGLTKREYFAAMAMQGFITAEPQGVYEHISMWAVNHADALIAALNKDSDVKNQAAS